MSDIKKETYLEAERKHARRVLGFIDDSGDIVAASKLSKEDLLERFRMSVARHGDNVAKLNGSIKALEDRLRSARKAKNLANARADKAEKAMRQMLDTFSSSKKEGYSQ